MDSGELACKAQSSIAAKRKARKCEAREKKILKKKIKEWFSLVS